MLRCTSKEVYRYFVKDPRNTSIANRGKIPYLPVSGCSIEQCILSTKIVCSPGSLEARLHFRGECASQQHAAAVVPGWVKVSCSLALRLVEHTALLPLLHAPDSPQKSWIENFLYHKIDIQIPGSRILIEISQGEGCRGIPCTQSRGFDPGHQLRLFVPEPYHRPQAVGRRLIWAS